MWFCVEGDVVVWFWVLFCLLFWVEDGGIGKVFRCGRILSWIFLYVEG